MPLTQLTSVSLGSIYINSWFTSILRDFIGTLSAMLKVTIWKSTQCSLDWFLLSLSATNTYYLLPLLILTSKKDYVYSNQVF